MSYRRSYMFFSAYTITSFIVVVSLFVDSTFLDGRNGSYGIGGGSLHIQRSPFNPQFPTYRGFDPGWEGKIFLLPEVSYTSADKFEIWLPYWPIAVVLPMLAYRAGRKVSKMTKKASTSSLCTSCGYSRVGLNPEAPCPECGFRSSMAHTGEMTDTQNAGTCNSTQTQRNAM